MTDVEQEDGSGSVHRLSRSDAWLLAALTEGSHDGRPVDLHQFVHDADWLNRLIPTFDEVSYGLPRLVEAGFMTVGLDAKQGVVFRATPKAVRLRRSVTAKSLGDVLAGVGHALGVPPYPEPERGIEDRHLGRLPGLESDQYEFAVRRHGAWVMRWATPLAVVLRAQSVPFMLGAKILSKWRQRKF